MKNTIEYQDKKFNISTEGKYSIWKILPFLAFNELVLGMRKPKETWTEINLKKYHEDRLFIPCKECGALHPSKIWSNTSELAYGNWYGLYCNNCQHIIPCVRNYFSKLILFLLSPITILFENKHKEKWLNKQAIRYKKYEEIGANFMYTAYYWVFKSWWNATILASTIHLLFPILFKEPILWNKFFYSFLFYGFVYSVFEFVTSVKVRKK